MDSRNTIVSQMNLFSACYNKVLLVCVHVDELLDERCGLLSKDKFLYVWGPPMPTIPSPTVQKRSKDVNIQIKRSISPTNTTSRPLFPSSSPFSKFRPILLDFVGDFLAVSGVVKVQGEVRLNTGCKGPSRP